MAPRTAQAAMRHSTIDLTMNVYTDPKLLDVHGALDSLPALPLELERQSIDIAVKATGTDDLPTSPFAPAFAPTPDNSSKSESIRCQIGRRDRIDPRAVQSTTQVLMLSKETTR